MVSRLPLQSMGFDGICKGQKNMRLMAGKFLSAFGFACSKIKCSFVMAAWKVRRGYAALWRYGMEQLNNNTFIARKATRKQDHKVVNSSSPNPAICVSEAKSKVRSGYIVYIIVWTFPQKNKYKVIWLPQMNQPESNVVGSPGLPKRYTSHTQTGLASIHK